MCVQYKCPPALFADENPKKGETVNLNASFQIYDVRGQHPVGQLAQDAVRARSAGVGRFASVNLQSIHNLKRLIVRRGALDEEH